MKTAVSIPDKLFRSADALAKRLGMSRSQLYATALADFMSRRQSQQVKERLDAIYGEEESALDPTILELQKKSLPPEEW
jgi:metal-responsive CopG/Arc/MetJ family transcriptional regulator